MFTPTDPPIAQADLPDGARRCVEIAGRTLVVFNVAGTFYAISNTCPHAGRPLEDGELRGKVLTCPFHGYAYRVDTGANIDFPDIEPPVVTFPVRIHDGHVEVDVTPDALDQATKTPPPPPFQ